MVTPHLLHFTRRYAPVFFGREAEVRELLDRLTASEGRFVIVSGDSGCGKSSLVDAGALSRLQDGSENGSLYSRFTGHHRKRLSTCSRKPQESA
jgi:ABC-type lipoprotein export system ATPase subunit